MIRTVAIDELPETGNLPITVEGVDLLIVRSAAGVFAIENMCSHAYQRLEGGKVKGPHIFCPMHGVRFDMRNGCPAGNLTKQPIKVWHAEVADGWVMVDLARRVDQAA
jgi:nitrite reductase/ring-hydroxylating ferredoxin subunit